MSNIIKCEICTYWNLNFCEDCILLVKNFELTVYGYHYKLCYVQRNVMGYLNDLISNVGFTEHLRSSTLSHATLIDSQQIAATTLISK